MHKLIGRTTLWDREGMTRKAVKPARAEIKQKDTVQQVLSNH